MPLLFNIVLEVLVTAIKEEKEKESKLEKQKQSCHGLQILYIGNSKDTTRKILELINEFSKVGGYKINTQKFVAFLYADNERSERGIKEIIPFTITSKRIKYLGK